VTLKGTVWKPIGPSPIAEGSTNDNGLASAIAVNPYDGDVIYVGTAAGGVWVTHDGGARWKPVFDRQLSLGIGEPAGIAIDPNDTDTIYIGTSGRVAQQPQAGLYKSTDAGASCVRLGSGYPAWNVGNASQFFYQWINVVIVDPADSQIVYLASSSGVFKSVDGGLHWTAGTGLGGDTRSLVLDESSPPGGRILYAGVSGAGGYTSTDGGQTWTPILTAATPAVSSAIGTGGFGKVIIALAPPLSPPVPAGIQVLYASLQGTGGAPDPLGVFLSTDQGATWTQRTATGMPGNTQGGYSFHMAVDPASPGDGANDIIYFGAVGQAKSTDSGNSFTGMSGLHADTHAWTFYPPGGGSPSVVYCGNDGGIFRSTDGGSTWKSLNAGHLQTSLFYNIDIKPDATASVTVGSLQDNQTETTNGSTGLGWKGTNGGDGWDVAYDGGIAGQVYTTSGFWSPAPCTRLFRSTDDGAAWGEITPWGTTSDAGCYLAPIGTDPSNGGVVYVCGSQNLWQSQDGGNTWRIITAVTGTGYTEVAPKDGNNVLCAASGRLLLSTNALAATVGPPNGVTFTDITRNLSGGRVQRAMFDPNDPTIIFAVLGGFGGGHVFRTTIGGTAWTDISPPVDVPFGALELDGKDTPTTIYTGTDLGVLRSRDLGQTWTVLDDIHFPRAPVTDLVFNPEARMLRAATYGRGVFEFTKPKEPAIAINLADDLNFGTVCNGPSFLTIQVFNVGEEDLVVDSIQWLMGSTDFSVLPTPGTPVVIGSDEEVDFTVQFLPSIPGQSETATIRIASNDPGAPTVDLAATGVAGTGTATLIIADSGDFGHVCVGSFKDEPLTINNSGTCPLTIFGISSSGSEFVVPEILGNPPEIAPGASIELPIRFQPTSFGAFSSTITVFTSDPASPATVTVTGTAPAGQILMTGSPRFGAVELGKRVQQTVSICNQGECDLHVTSVSLQCCCDCDPGPDCDGPTSPPPTGCEHFCLVNNPFPASIRPGACVGLVVAFKPTCDCVECCELVIESDDPNSPTTKVRVTGRLRRTLTSAIKCWLGEELRDMLGE
jgi:hypothetical protein